MKYLNDYKCSCGYVLEGELVEGDLESIKTIERDCPQCSQKTEMTKLIGGYKSRWRYFD